MALIHSKQLNPKLTGSFTVSGSIVGDSKSTGSFGRVDSNKLNVSGDVTIGGNINIGDSNTDSLKISADLSSSLIPDADSTYDLGSSTKFWKDGYIDTLTTTGNISGSSVTTASFGKIKLNDDTHLNVGAFAISGSSTSTASFGRVQISEIAGNSPITFADTIIENQNLQVLGSITGSGDVDFNGNLDVDGITNLDNTDIDGTLTVDGTNTTITSPIINLVGPISASSNISASGNLVLGGQITSTGDIRTSGDIIAENLIISSSVTYMTQSFSSGSTIFGDSNDDTHQFTGSLLNKGSITSTGNITVTGNIIAQGSINANQGQVFGSGIDDRHEFTGSVVVTGSLNVEKGRVFEQGTSVIDHATAMAIVFGG